MILGLRGRGQAKTSFLKGLGVGGGGGDRGGLGKVDSAGQRSFVCGTYFVGCARAVQDVGLRV